MRVFNDLNIELVSLPLNRYRKVAEDFCLDQGAMKEYI